MGKSNMGGWHEFIRYSVCAVFLLIPAYLPAIVRESRAVVQLELGSMGFFSFFFFFFKADQQQQ